MGCVRRLQRFKRVLFYFDFYLTIEVLDKFVFRLIFSAAEAGTCK